MQTQPSRVMDSNPHQASLSGQAMDTSGPNPAMISQQSPIMASQATPTTEVTIAKQPIVPDSSVLVPSDASLSNLDTSNTNRPRSITPDGQSRKRRRLDPTEDMQTLYDFMRKYKREDGSELCEMFVRAPKRRNDPQYYEVVTDPIDMLRIKQKLSTDEYANMAELKDDFQRLFSNALSYYKTGTSEARDAQELKELFAKAISLVEAGEDPVAILGDREDNDDTEIAEMVEDLFASVMTATDLGDPDRHIHQVFRLVPSKQRYPEYYEVITDPIDLKMIATKIRDGDYKDINNVEEDLNRMCRNAQMFNEPGSQIYKDAKTIMKIVKTKKGELEAIKNARQAPESKPRRVSRSRLNSHKKHYSSEIADLQYEDSESEESSEEEYDQEDPLAVLYSYVRHYKAGTLAEPFLQLPSKREHPDYYLTIGDPISLNEIKKKLKGQEYENLTSLYEDLDLMFENCKEYNRPDSRLYKDGIKLHRAMKHKYDEMAGSDENEDDNSDDDSDENSDEESDDVDEEEDEMDKAKVRTPKQKSRLNCRQLYNSIYQYRNIDNVQLIDMFMHKPSKRDYPDYYDIISNPMDMRTIDQNIKNNRYKSVDAFMTDVKLMFNNCRTYNEEGSDIYNDANTLETVLSNKYKELGLYVPTAGQRVGFGPRRSLGAQGIVVARQKMQSQLKLSGKALQDKMKNLVDKIREHKDEKGRQLSLIFLRLPNAKEFPDYYQVIKKPVDFEKIAAKVKGGVYQSMRECMDDFMLMFDNASKYNEPDSQIYKDALTLQALALKESRILLEDQNDDTAVPDVLSCVQEILSTIFVAMYNHHDAEERCYSDCLAELPEHDITEGKKNRALNLDLIKRRLDRCLYKRLDLFQRDIFSVLERARNLSRTDSQIFEDSCELQKHFIKIRDEACNHGELFQSRALLYTQTDLKKSVDDLRSQKQANEAPEEMEDKKGKDSEGVSGEGSAMFNQQQYHVGDFVYVANKEIPGGESKIFLIEKIYRTNPHLSNGVWMMAVNQFFRPVETFHVPTRKFLDREVFCTDVRDEIRFDSILGKCFVMTVKDYFRMRPVGFDDKDVWVCENRYNTKSRSFKKIKVFWNEPEHIKLTYRESPLEPTRVMSVFKERIEKHKEEIEELEALEKTVDIPLPPNVIWASPLPLELPIVPQRPEGSVYFEQYTIPGPITLRRGDSVYVRAENGKNLVAQIDIMWTNPIDNMAYFHGPWFVTKGGDELVHMINHPFYPRESFISTIQDTNPLLSIVGRCCVLEVSDFKTMRPTHYDETDIYICESVYDESRRQIGPLPPTGLKTYEHISLEVLADEVYYFKSPINVRKEIAGGGIVQGKANPYGAPGLMGEYTASAVMMDPSMMPTAITGAAMDLNEDSLDAPPSVSSTEAGPVMGTPSTPGTPAPGGKDKKNKDGKRKPVTPYILFASLVRRQVKDANEGMRFGQISRVIGDQWKALSDAEKSIYEEKCKELNKENARKYAADHSLADEQRKLSTIDLRHHSQHVAVAAAASTAQQNGTISVSSMQGQQIISQAQQQQQIGGNTTGGQVATLLSQQGQQLKPMGGTNQLSPTISGATSGLPVPTPRQIEPMFHTVPPRPQRLLHSEAYIRYIEGLTSDRATMCDWNKQLNSSKENTRTDEAKLPAHWLADNGEHPTSLDALWALRDFLVQDSLGVVKVLNHASL